MNLLFSNDRRGEYPPSLYAASRSALPAFPRQQGEERADVVVVGAGYTGLSAALHLAEAGRDVMVLEAHRVGFGASGRNGGQLGSGQRLEVDELERLAGPEAARRLWDMAEEAKALTRALAARCQVPVADGIAHAFRKPAEFDHARRLIDKLARDYGYDRIEPLARDAFRALVPSDAYIAGELDHGAGHLNPLELVLGLARLADAAGARLRELSHVHHIRHARLASDKTVVQTERGRVLCDHVILAGNGYMGQLNGHVAARVMPINNFIVATEPLGPRAAQVLTRNIGVHDTKFVVNYWRLDPEGRLIFGGGENVSYRFPADIFAKVRKPLLSIYPQLADVALTHAWGGTLAITMNRMPCFARPAPNCLSASGYSGHGLALANLAGKLMAQAVLGQAQGFDTMAALPSRPFPGGAMLRWPLLVAGMSWYSLRDRLGF
ncbi:MULTISPECIES: NAD(P)/FAD-dependent oxidoreductase [unclassified Paracoccus (in: a-proteobacteria)]|uniref:NAD(P)/FAD-dependent oxidoreductase n=1 Tax=unclassified Paracoccus (in: a-proteobacteria) TaxID=2688777 RepID=UPI0012B2A38B|nr:MULTISPECIES: FAD-binding oxidoreductase [unclassified Paracoccus (in: a-proteobacteria)]UXU74542.1 FAD-binding oxidoreductase [Paracoccus sp. SMMA_5]UXU80435.1 FAD-binding oxidoreductase [Paracoccus sp. SMMA_5_TC]